MSLASVIPSSFGLISATFVFGRLLTVFSLSVKYGASQLKKPCFLSPVSACFASRLPELDLDVFLNSALFLQNLFLKLSNRRLAFRRLRESCVHYYDTPCTVNLRLSIEILVFSLYESAMNLCPCSYNSFVKKTRILFNLNGKLLIFPNIERLLWYIYSLFFSSLFFTKI